MARVKYTRVKNPLGKRPPKTKAEVIATAQDEANRHKTRINEIVKNITPIKIKAGIQPKKKTGTKTKANLKTALTKKKATEEKMRNNLPMLDTVAKRRKGYKILLQNPTNDVVTIFCNCARNLLKGNTKLSGAQIAKLGPHKENIQTLAKPNTSIAKKKKIIQTGGFFPLLAAGALGALAPTLLGGLFG